MGKLALTGGFYQAKSLIANAQRAVNVYPERNPEDAPFPFTHYLTPGLTQFAAAASAATVRGLYRTTTSVLYAVIGQALYEVSSSGILTSIGTLIASASTPVAMVDNGFAMVIVDGSPQGYAVDISPSGQIINATLNGGQGYTDGTYTEVLTYGGSGTGALATLTITNGVVISATFSGGSGYQIGDILSVPISIIGEGFGYLSTVTQVSTINNFSQIVGGFPTSFYGATNVQYADTYFIFNRPGTNDWYISLSNVTFELLTESAIMGGIILIGDYTFEGTWMNVPLTGGSGTGATATITIGPNTALVTSVTIENAGSGYSFSDVLSATLPGSIVNGTLVGGSGYTNGTYNFVPWTGGSGSGAGLQNGNGVTVSGGVVTAVNLNGGAQYKVGDVLSPGTSIGPGSGASFTITSIQNNPPVSGMALQYSVSTTGAQAFDPLAYASKTGYADWIQTIAVMHREIWLIGQLTTEIWYNTGASDFTYGIMPGVFVEHGCVAPYSLAKQDLTLFWLSQDLQGQAIVVMGASYQTVRVSTHAIEQVFSGYSTISDAIGYTYQQEGHVFYVLSFPTANATWVYDITTQLWHQRAYTDSNGNLNRHRSNCAASCYGLNIVGDYSNGTLYTFDSNNYTDNGNTISRIRSFPHLQNEDKRVNYKFFIADMEVGNAPGILTPQAPQVSLRWSDNRGETWSNHVEQSLGGGGQYLTSIKWSRLGMARDRVFELSWSANVKTALNGAYVDQVLMGS